MRLIVLLPSPHSKKKMANDVPSRSVPIGVTKVSMPLRPEAAFRKSIETFRVCVIVPLQSVVVEDCVLCRT